MSKDDFSRGWDFFVDLAAADTAYKSGHSFAKQRLDAINAAIKEMENSINSHPHKNNTLSTFQGYVAEELSVGTLNINAAAAGSSDFAKTPKSNELGSVDAQLDSGKSYSMKSFYSGEKSAVEQARMNPLTGKALYEKQGRWVPTDQLDAAKSEALKRMNKELNNPGREHVGEAYKDTYNNLTDHIENSDGIKSDPLTRDELDASAADGKAGKYKAEDHGITAGDRLKLDYVLGEALQAGYTAATLTFAFQMAPEIYKCIDYLIKNGEIDLEQLAGANVKAISSSAQGFINGFLSSFITIQAQKGSFGDALKNVSGAWIGLAVSIISETIKDSIRLARGKISAREMGVAFIDRVAVGVAFTAVGTQIVSSLASTEVAAAISGAIAQVIGWQLPVVSYVIGSLVGCAISAVYNFGKKVFLSICVDTGFTCFGLVEQDYEMPVEYLQSIGVDVVLPDFLEANYSDADFSEPDYLEPDFLEPETIQFYQLKRGIIGVNKVGYVPAS